MSAVGEADAVGLDERLARFIFQRSHVHADGTPKPNSFIPDSRLELSVMRCQQLAEFELWKVGRAIGAVSSRTLHARSDVVTGVFVGQKLRVLAAPEADNVNHANVVDWPPDKPTQKSIAQEIAAKAGKVVMAPMG
jgi:hypothetical protein